MFSFYAYWYITSIKKIVHLNTYCYAIFFFTLLYPLAALSITPSSTLNLTSTETQWLEKHTSITFTGDPNWLPYEAFTPEGEYVGIVAEHLKLISQATGLTFNLSPSKTWTESTQKAIKGEVDVLSETDDSDLKSHLNFTQSYLSNPIVIAMSIHENYVENISSIADKHIALIKDYGYAAKIRRKYSQIEFITVDDIQDGLISVSTGKTDALLCTLALCSYTINELGISNVKIIGKTEFDTKLALGVQKNQPELLSILNKAINTITQKQQQLILDKWIHQEYSKTVDYTITILVTLIALLLILIFVNRNRQLFKEITLRKTVEQQLIEARDTNERYRILFFESPVGHALNEFSTGNFLSVNQSFSKITGYTLDEINQLSYWDLTPKDHEKDEQTQLKLLKETGQYGPYEKHYFHKSGKLVAVRLNGSLITEPSGEQLILSVVEDISAFAEAKEKLRLSSLVLENSSEAMLITNEKNEIMVVNPAFSQITGYQLDEIQGKTPNIFKSGKHDTIFYKAMWRQIETEGRWQGEIWDKRKDGGIYAKWMTIDTIKDEKGNINRYVALFSDITERKQSQETIWKQANYDPLTQLPNRHRLRYKLKQEIKRTSRNNSIFALLLIDLDHFKEVNDTLGHDMGDLLLTVASKRILNCVRDSDTVARLGGDEFTIILSEIDKHQTADQIAHSLIKTLSKPYHLENEIVHISASIGITLFPTDARSIDVLLKNADQAMYQAKSLGRNQYCHFTQSLQDAAQKKLRLSNDLRQALSLGQLKIYFQPIVDLSSNKVVKAEALLRWTHPDQGMISPLDFIPLAEEIGVISEIGQWVCCQSSQLKQRWSNQFNIDFQITVNMSPIQFKEPIETFGDDWLIPKEQQDSFSKNITIEITEGLLLNAETEILDKMYRLRDAGVEVAIDDFGTGYSSLSYLKKFDIDYLKIDQSFTRNLENDPNDLALSKAIIVMAHKLGLKVIAEGVETKEQEVILSNEDCDFAQGYLYSKPIPENEFELFLTQHYAQIN